MGPLTGIAGIPGKTSPSGENMLRINPVLIADLSIDHSVPPVNGSSYEIKL